MSWAKLDDRFHCHAKSLGCSLAAVGTFALSLSWAGSQEKDGVIPTHVALHLARNDATLPDELVRVGLWDAHPDGYAIHDYLHYNPSAKSLQKKRKAAKGRMRALRGRSRSVRANISSVARQPVPRGRDGSGVTQNGGVQGEPPPAFVTFDRFWIAYPRKVDKQDAARAFERLEASERDAAIAGLPPWVAYWAIRGDESFIPHAATWLHKRRWESLPPKPPKSVPVKRGPVETPPPRYETADELRARLAADVERKRREFEASPAAKLASELFTKAVTA